MARITLSTHIESSIHYATITMHDDGKFDPVCLAEFNAALDTVYSDVRINALIITGEEKTFSQGLDIEHLISAGTDGAATFIDECMEMVGRLLILPIPLVSAVNGHAFGLGAMILMASDYKVMREDRGYFCLPEVDLNMVLIPSMNALVRDKLAGQALRDLLLTGKRIGGGQAVEYNVVDQCCDLDDLLSNAKALLQPMLGKSRDTLSGLKAGLHQDILRYID
ncbi:MAG: enoyl-CoA hydratase/isomerase family protein [Cellvibrionales bacterium]|nr:enoyl-CoA hydratase/isomerase family protein [Cellvibrionales bacterium]